MRQCHMSSRQRRVIQLKRRVAASFVLVIIGVITIFILLTFMPATASAQNNNEAKLYKSVYIESGDTLLDIAAKYSDEHYRSLDDYVDEVMAINSLPSETITSGSYLVIPYYVGITAMK